MCDELGKTFALHQIDINSMKLNWYERLDACWANIYEKEKNNHVE